MSKSHGHTRGGPSPEYSIWSAMKRRCNNRNCKDYPEYGGRGIRVCARWESFENFLADMGERPVGLTLDRKDVNGDYTPDNCHWATPTHQRHNQRRGVKLSPDEVRWLWFMCTSGLPYRDAARLFGVTSSYVYQICLGKSRREA